MRVRLLAFASAREALGAEETDLELAEGSDLDALRATLTQRHDDLRELWPRLAIAIDGELVRGNATLRDGQEIALLPPVSGGLEELAALVDGPIDVEAVVAAVQSNRRGAVVVFLGNVRGDHDQKTVEQLTYEAYRTMALLTLKRISEEISSREGELAVAIHHRLGAVPAGETSVVIAAASPHREAAYAASRTALERLKREVPIWKREHYAGGDAAWREEEPLGAVSDGGGSS